ncbi:thiamine diphosphate-binding protein [Pisolithus albus]|nr:thiamine diphosphate-binding protein [Pisolithus albus]
MSTSKATTHRQPVYIPPDIIREQIPNKWEKLMSVLASVMREIPSEAAEDHQIREWMGQFEEVSAQIEELRQFTAGMSTEVPEYPEEAKEAVSSRLLTLAVLRNRLDGKAKVKAAPAAPRDPETGGEVRRSRRQQEKTAAEGGGSKSDHTGDPVVGHSTTLASRGKVAEGDTILPDTVTNMSDVEVGILQLPLCELSPEPVEVPQSINFLEPGSGELLFNATNFALGSGNLEDQLRFIPFCALLLFFFFPRLSPLILRVVCGGNVINDLGALNKPIVAGVPRMRGAPVLDGRIRGAEEDGGAGVSGTILEEGSNLLSGAARTTELHENVRTDVRWGGCIFFYCVNLRTSHLQWGLTFSCSNVFSCENNKYGMSTSEERSSSNTEYFTRGDKIPGLQVNGMDIITSHHAVQFARNWVVEGNGPLFMEFVTYRYGGLVSRPALPINPTCDSKRRFFPSMSDPGTTYRTREEIQWMRSTQSPTRGLQRYIEEWGLTSPQELRQPDKEAKAEVDQAIEEAKTSPARRSKGLWTGIYDKGPPFNVHAGTGAQGITRHSTVIISVKERY